MGEHEDVADIIRELEKKRKKPLQKEIMIWLRNISKKNYKYQCD